MLTDPGTSAVLIATRHDDHARLVVGALMAGKHVFVEKPLCITPRELADIEDCLADARRQRADSDGRLQPPVRAGDAQST